MPLSSPRAVGFAVRGGMPVDAADWVTVDLGPFLEQRSRGLMIATEPVEPDGHGFEMARVTRELIISELRAMEDLPPAEAIGRAFATANGMLFDEGQTSPTRGYDRKVLIGATAVVLEGHRCVVGHVPPGQVVFIEDALAYTVPDLQSWAPSFITSEEMPISPEPLGYTSWTAPILAETELSDGDEVFICSASLAESLASDLADTELRPQDLASYHGRSPDAALDVFKGLLIADRIEDGAALVLAFPPQPGSLGTASMDDVRWRLRHRRRRARAQVRALLPRRREAAAVAALEGAEGDSVDEDTVQQEEPAYALRSPVRRMLSRRRRSADTWVTPGEARQYGLPRTHGVQLHRSVSIDRGEPGWRAMLPRIPLAGPLLVALVLGLLVVLTFGSWSLRSDEPADTTQLASLGEIDQYILAAAESSDPDDARQALTLAEQALFDAEEEGAPAPELAPRRAAITSSLDEIDNVLRLDNIARIGTLPDPLQGGGTSALLTGSGLFLVNGGLYQIRTDQQQVLSILEPGETAGGVEVGSLFDVAVDSVGLHVTDGDHVWTLQTDGSWAAVELGRINNLPWQPRPVGAFGGGIYLLQPEFRQIYRFDTEIEDGVAEPVDWVLASVAPELVRAVDMTISRSIHVLLDNTNTGDEVLTYTRGDLDSREMVPYLDLETTRPVAVLDGSATQLLYVAAEDEDGGVVVVFDPASDDAWQLRLPTDFSVDEADVAAPFEDLQDVAIDEDTGTLYLVNDDAVWTAQYELPVDATSTPMPQPEGVQEEGG
ncbi:MAG TPA: hypothetical protein VGR22_07140 [Thermomicrobiales bacterium]|nr:hypothetical protein [Thermomicrobiales bacterium]